MFSGRACESVPTEVFFAADDTEAKRVCRRCDWQSECLTMFYFEPAGVFGGLNEDERARLRRTIPRSRMCLWCQKPLPPGAFAQQQYHDVCLAQREAR